MKFKSHYKISRYTYHFVRGMRILLFRFSVIPISVPALKITKFFYQRNIWTEELQRGYGKLEGENGRLPSNRARNPLTNYKLFDVLCNVSA